MKAQPTIDPVEWDFRGVTEDELDIAIQYELARSNVRARTALAKWRRGEKLKRVVAGTDGTQLITNYIFKKGTEFESYGPLKSIIRVCRRFPSPWLSNPKSDRETAVRLFGVPDSALRIEPATGEFGQVIANHICSGRAGSGYYIDVDFSKPVAEIASAFEEWLRTEAKNRRKRRIDGNASAPKFHILRQLAAFRLHDAGLGYEAAQDFVARVRRSRRTQDLTDAPVLPNYDSRNAWYNAISAARNQISKVA